jgi:hypothetical protein
MARHRPGHRCLALCARLARRRARDRGARRLRLIPAAADPFFHNMTAVGAGPREGRCLQATGPAMPVRLDPSLRCHDIHSGATTSSQAVITAGGAESPRRISNSGIGPELDPAHGKCLSRRPAVVGQDRGVRNPQRRGNRRLRPGKPPPQGPGRDGVPTLPHPRRHAIDRVGRAARRRRARRSNPLPAGW